MGEANTKCKVSVIMPCYNDGAYLEEAVASLKKQTYQDTELIIIDDGSDDPSTIEVLNHLDFPALTVLHTDHVRPAAARNEGVKHAHGEYILPLDSDDTIEPEYIERAVEVLDTNPNVGIVYCHADLFGEMTGKWDLPNFSMELELLDNCIFVTSMFRKKDWETVGGFDSTGFTHGMEDYDFWLSILGLGREVVQFPEVYFHYRIKPRSRTTEFNSNYSEVQNTYIRLYERHRDLIADNMDLYCKKLRWELIDHMQMLANLRNKPVNAIASEETDPVIVYWRSLRQLKPRTAATIEKLLHLKDSIKRLIGRA